jgi:hypothetical protein
MITSLVIAGLLCALSFVPPFVARKTNNGDVKAVLFLIDAVLTIASMYFLFIAFGGWAGLFALLGAFIVMTMAAKVAEENGSSDPYGLKKIIEGSNAGIDK